MKIDRIEIESELLRRIGAVADEEGIEIYLVGGYVRDRMLGKRVTDIDFTVVGDGVGFTRLLAKRLRAGEPVGYEKFGTAMLQVEGHKLEFVGTRKEEYLPDSRKPVVRTASLAEDLARRDFTCNAIAAGLNAPRFGALIDPFDGRGAIERKILVTPLEPEQTFSDDPLRMMRACRFAAQLGFAVDPAALEAIGRMAPRIAIVSVERTRDELLKILAAPVPSVGLDLLHRTGLLRHVFPELHALAGVDQRSVDYPEGPRSFHHKDVFYHTLLVVDNVARASEKIWLRFAALMHDIAKPATKSFDEKSGWSFHGHEILGSRMMRGIFQRLRLPLEPLRFVQKMISLHLRPIALVKEEVTDSAIRRILFEAGEEIDDLMILCRADITSKNPARVNRYLRNYEEVARRMILVEEKDKLRRWQPPLRGEEIMEICGIDEGIYVGILKTRIEDAILDGIIPNEHAAARDYLVKIKDEVLAGPSEKPVPLKKKLKNLPPIL